MFDIKDDINIVRQLFDLEERRRERMHFLATQIQKMWRGWRQRTLYLRMREAQIVISARFRCYWVMTCL